MTRILTLQIELIEGDEPLWLWDYQKEKDISLGFLIQVIQEGPIPERVEDDD